MEWSLHSPKKTAGWVWWLTLVIPALERPRWVDHFRPVQDLPEQYGEALSLLKIQKLARYGGACL